MIADQSIKMHTYGGELIEQGERTLQRGRVECNIHTKGYPSPPTAELLVTTYKLNVKHTRHRQTDLNELIKHFRVTRVLSRNSNYKLLPSIWKKTRLILFIHF